MVEYSLGETALHWGDILVILGYLAAVMAVGIWSSCRNRGSVGGYFLAGRSMHWIPVGASLFASNIGSGHFIGLAGSGASSGIGIAVFELNAIFILLILGWIFVPVYIAAGVYTMPEYLRKRFGGQRIRIYLAVLTLILYVFTKISADLYSGALFIQLAMGWNLPLAITALLLLAALFTIAGGLTAVIWTDFIQTVIMVIGAFILMVMSFVEVGGYNPLIEKFFAAVPNTTRDAAPNDTYAKCGIPPANSMNLIRSIDDGSLPWLGVMVGLTISSVWYWCSDQVIVQRALASKDLSHAKGGTVLAGYLKILPMWLIVYPGMIARILFPDEVGCADPDICYSICGSRNGCTNIAFPLLVIRLLPPGLRGLMLAVMMSALMSSLTSIFNSGSTIFTMDIWRRIRKRASDIELMIVGRVFVLILVVISVVWIPIVQSVSELFHYIQAVTSFLAPPICAVYVLAVAWKRINEQGAFWGLMIGLVTGLARFIWEYSYGPAPPCGETSDNPIPPIISKVHYLHFGILLFFISAIATIVISLLTKAIPDEYLYRLTFFTRFSTETRMDISEQERIDNAKPEKEGVDNQGMKDSDINLSVMNSNGTTENTVQPEPAEKKLPWYKTAFNWICGIEKMQGGVGDLTPEQRAAMDAKQISIVEVPLHRRICNANAIILMVVATFLWGFFA
ncbi:sodium/glucose cotransporter 4 isoform X1 [Lingula anatina]|uniref:Sodium/glucose cotransporter 4 isoform X1 n=1 Tax=Lingula anatina TaxID=7574 RepID=A0A1S3KGV5_LINAN|nr:sodium/glucose cotransporter 4 isoform X1 [Lingula anatina]|eukprot:XP_013421875.1 sodium/glucose cotransporter 4 isoform X1 [Lingula anatina]